MAEAFQSAIQYWKEYIRDNETLSRKDAKSMCDELSLPLLMRLANYLTMNQVGSTVSYAVSYNINYSNYCAASCPICAFYIPIAMKGKRTDGYELTLDQVKFELNKAKQLMCTEIHMVGGLNSDLPLEYYEEIFKTVKSVLPNVTLKALTIPEIDFISRVTGNSLREVISRFKEAGMDAHTGGGAEIFDPEIRRLITTQPKISGEEWLADAKLIHLLGVPGNSTITYGHIEKLEHIIDHIIRIRDSQIEVPGFLSIIPLKFSPGNTALQKSGTVSVSASGELDLKVVALSRILAGKELRNVGIYWVSLGKEIAQIALNGGGNDLVGTAFSEKIFSATNKREYTSIEELDHMITQINRTPVQRDTFFSLKKRKNYYADLEKPAVKRP